MKADSDENDEVSSKDGERDDIKERAEEAGIGLVKSSDDAEVADTNDEEKKEEDKKKYANWPFRDIKEPHANDVLYGRGGGTNHHPGNKIYRKMVEERKINYVNCKRLDKPLVALGIIREWRGQTPPGRFLKMDEKTGLWNDVGDKKAREKTSQALRERAPQIRQEIEKERVAKVKKTNGESSDDDDDDEPYKSTRFAAGTNLDVVKKPSVVARDHSLGREYLDPDEGMTLEGFSWQEPVRGGSDVERISSQGSHVPPPQMPYGHPGSRVGSYTSYGPQHPPPPGPYEHMASIDRHMRYASWNRYESWGSVSGGPPLPPSAPYGPYPVHSGAWAREHSLGAIPLQHATVSQAAYPAAFDHRTGSGHWGPPPYASYPMEGPPVYHMSGGYHHGQYPHGPPQPAPPRHDYSGNGPLVAPPSPSYSVDPSVASQWSGKDRDEIALTLSGSGEEHDSFNPTTSPAPRRTIIKPKPDIIKRATSNQNETIDTKPDFDGHSVKRAALNRDSSTAANRLKEKYMPEYFDAKKEMERLSTNLEQSTLETGGPKPSQLSKEDRMMTLDMQSLDLVIKPTSFRVTSRSTTIDALALAFDDDDDDVDPFIGSGQFDRHALSPMDDLLNDTKPGSVGDSNVVRPVSISAAQRLTTSDLIDIVNEPIEDDD